MALPGRLARFGRTVGGYLVATGLVGLASGVGWVLFGPGDTADVGMIFLLAVVVAALRYGSGPSLLAAALSGAGFAFFFAPPIFRFSISDLTHIVTFLVLVGVAVVVSELARRVRVRERESEARRLEVEREHLRGTLLGAVSHDLRTPLASIMGAASALATDGDGMPPATRTELARSIQHEAERLNRRVRELLDMTRLESGAVTVRKEWEAVEDVVGAALARAEALLAGRPVVTRIPDDLPLVPMDAQLVEQVLTNLVENAVKYSDPGTPVEVSVTAGPDEIVVEVADRGPGLPDGEEERVFTKFVRLDNGRRSDGVGLGLAVCRAIVELHGGWIRAQNRDGGGGAFRFGLPLEGAPPRPPEGDEAPTEA